MKKIGLTLFLMISLILTGCSASKAAEQMVSESAAPRFIEAQEAPAAAFASDSAMMDYDQNGATTQAVAVERIVIKNASLSIVVDNPAEALDFISRLADTSGGFVVSSNLYKSYTSQGVEVPAANITIRVPAELLTQSMDQIKGLVSNPGQDIQDENISGQDVTQEYTDLQSRLRNLQRAEEQLQEIMASANKTEDVLAIFNQLKQVREDIEVLQGQINYYNESSRLSSISVYITSTEANEPLTIGRWEPVGVARDAIQALIDALKFIVNVLIWMLLFIAPVGLIIGIPLWLILRAAKRRRAARKAEKAQKLPENPETKN